MLSTPSRLIVAVADDDARISLVENLEADGYQLLATRTLAHTRSRLGDNIDAILVDLGSETVDLIDQILEGGGTPVKTWVPIIAGTTSDDLCHPVRLLDRGADDVVYEPCIYLETRARLNAVLRRAEAWRTRQVLRTGDLRVNLRARQVWMGQTEIQLCGREYELLRVLASDPDRVFTRSELLETVWGLGGWARTRSLDSHASRLRRKLNDHGGDWIHNVWGGRVPTQRHGRDPGLSGQGAVLAALVARQNPIALQLSAGLGAAS